MTDMETGVASSVALTRAADQRLGTALWLTLCVFVLALPLVEAPKNIAGGLFLLLWVLHAARTRDAGGPWDRFDTAFALMLVSAGLSAWIGDDGANLGGVFRVIAVTWVAKRVSLSQRQGVGILCAGCLGLALAIVMGSVPFIRRLHPYFELPSVGQVNQSALYIAVLACAALGWALQGRRSGRVSLPAAASAVLFGLVLLVTGSRAAILAYLLFVAAALLALLLHSGRSPRTRRILIGTGTSLLAAAALVIGLGTAYPHLSGSKLQAGKWVNVDSVDQRLKHWHLAWDAWRQKPWLGFGPESFGGLVPQQVCAWREQRGETCDPNEYSAATHAHSLYVATLVERGLLGVAALAYLLALWLGALVKSARQASWSPLWVGSAAGFTVVAVGGIFNTTLRVEHGSLALLLLGMWLAARLDEARKTG
jgi:O-antigen ligase